MHFQFYVLVTDSVHHDDINSQQIELWNHLVIEFEDWNNSHRKHFQEL